MGRRQQRLRLFRRQQVVQNSACAVSSLAPQTGFPRSGSRILDGFEGPTSMKEPTPKSVIIRDLVSYEDLQRAEELEREVWGLADRDAMPLALMVATREAGSVWVGAFDGENLAGFAFGFLGFEHGHLILHSHMLAVRERYRDLDLGYKLKLAQRERAMSMRVQEMTWTFDP